MEYAIAISPTATGDHRPRGGSELWQGLIGLAAKHDVRSGLIQSGQRSYRAMRTNDNFARLSIECSKPTG